MASVVILMEPYDRHLFPQHLIRHLAQRWAGAGHRVALWNGTGAAPPGDVAFLHVDRSVVPQPYLDAMRHFPVAVNGTVADIRKRAHSRNLLRRGDAFAGPVIVKSDLNSAGKPEAGKRNIARRRGKLGGPVERAPTNDYAIHGSIEEVPEAVWQDPALVVEKFAPERDGDFYVLRCYYFLGAAEVNMVLQSSHAIVKGANTLRVALAPPPPDIRALRRELGFDYGKFDYAMHDGRVMLFDANRTPSIATLQKQRVLDTVVERLAPGLESLLRA